jgi:hypothetical protein
MLRLVFTASALVFLNCLASAQSTTRPVYLDHAVVQQEKGTVTVVANAPLPLFQVISAFREEFGWRIDWEQAPGYTRFDVVDDTGPRWRSAHPDARGVTRPAGGRFTTSFPASLLASQAHVLTKILQDYNVNENPGRYTLLLDPHGRFTVVGTQVKDDSGQLRPIPPLLDTSLSINSQKRNVYETVRVIVAALSAATGKKVIIMSVPNNLFRNTEATIGGGDLTARQLLQQALDSTRRPLQYDFGYDPDVPVYILNVSLAAKAEDDVVGGRTHVPIDRTH